VLSLTVTLSVGVIFSVRGIGEPRW